MREAKNENWTDIENVPEGWINTIQRIIKSNKIPYMNGPDIYIASDYSGQHKQSKYELISVLYTDLENSSYWLENQNYMRKHILRDGRRISLKGLRDEAKFRSLIPFLKASFQIRGVLLTIAVNKEITDLCADIDFFSKLTKRLDLKGKWSLKSFDRMLFIVNIISVLMGGLSKSGQNIYWITDNDDFTANASRLEDLKKLIDRYSSVYVQKPLGEVGLGTTNIDPGDRIEEDLAAITDLSAGALSEVLNGMAKKFGKISHSVDMPYRDKLSDKTEIIMDWYFSKSTELLKELIVFEKEKTGYSVFKFNKQ